MNPVEIAMEHRRYREVLEQELGVTYGTRAAVETKQKAIYEQLYGEIGDETAISLQLVFSNRYTTDFLPPGINVFDYRIINHILSKVRTNPRGQGRIYGMYPKFCRIIAMISGSMAPNTGATMYRSSQEAFARSIVAEYCETTTPYTSYHHSTVLSDILKPVHTRRFHSESALGLSLAYATGNLSKVSKEANEQVINAISCRNDQGITSLSTLKAYNDISSHEKLGQIFAYANLLCRHNDAFNFGHNSVFLIPNLIKILVDPLSTENIGNMTQCFIVAMAAFLAGKEYRVTDEMIASVIALYLNQSDYAEIMSAKLLNTWAFLTHNEERLFSFLTASEIDALNKAWKSQDYPALKLGRLTKIDRVTNNEEN